jgi:hypothetical protein
MHGYGARLASQRRVCHEGDLVRLAEIEQLLLRKPWMRLDLIASGLDVGIGQQPLQLSDIEVGDTNSSHLTRGYQRLHGSPCRLVVG